MAESSKDISEGVVIEPKGNDFIQEKPRFKTGNITSGLFLIILGGILLLNTFGLLPWNVWGGFFITMLKFWPILLIFIGIRIVFGSNKYLKIFSDLLWILVILLAFGVSIVNFTGDSVIKEKLLNRLPFLSSLNTTNLFGSSDKRSDIKIAKSVEDTYKNIDLNLNVVAGEFELSDKDISDYLTLNSKYSENTGVPVVKETKSVDTLSLDFIQENKAGVFNFGSKSIYKMIVGEKTPIRNLSLNLTAGESNIDLKKVNVRTTDIKMTAGETFITFSEDSLPESINIKLVAGNVTLNFPSNIGVEVKNKSVAGDIKYNKVKIGENGMSQFNTDKTKKITLNIDQTAGDVSINTK